MADDSADNDDGESESEDSMSAREKYAVLVIQQTREVHNRIEDWLEALHATVLPDYESIIPSVDLSVD